MTQQKPHYEILSALAPTLLPWFAQNKREMPWRGEGVTAYHTWVSEIMLQQTRVEAVRSYYVRFLDALPTVEALAACEEDALLKLWEGLGYYSRVRNLQRAARIVVAQYGGELPRTRKELAALPGIGDYTAGAISSIAYGNPEPAVDGNVLRILSRITGDARCVDEPAVRKDWSERLRAVYPDTHCGDFTQALMELGAIVCLPNGAPLCGQCPMRDACVAYRQNSWAQLPVRKQKAERKAVALTVIVDVNGDRVYLRKRAAKGVLGGMWEFVNVEGTRSADEVAALCREQGMTHPTVTGKVRYVHVFTHLEWHVTAYRVDGGGAWQGATAFDKNTLEQEIGLASAFAKCKELL